MEKLILQKHQVLRGQVSQRLSSELLLLYYKVDICNKVVLLFLSNSMCLNSVLKSCTGVRTGRRGTVLVYVLIYRLLSTLSGLNKT